MHSQRLDGWIKYDLTLKKFEDSGYAQYIRLKSRKDPQLLLPKRLPANI